MSKVEKWKSGKPRGEIEVKSLLIKQKIIAKIFVQLDILSYLCNIVAKQMKCNEICGPTKEKFFLSARVIFS